MTPKQEFDQTVRIVAKAIMQTIKDYELIGELPDGADTNLIPNLMLNVRKEWNWVISKNRWEQAQDMIQDLYALMFIERADKLFKNYVVSERQSKKHAPDLVSYLKLPLQRAFQEISKKYYNKAKYEQDVMPMEGESSDQTFDRLMSAPKHNKILRYDDDYFEELNEIKSHYEEAIEKTDNKNTIKSLEKKLDKINKQIEEATNPKNFMRDIEEYANENFSVEEDIAFDKIVDFIEDKIKLSSQDAEAQITVFKSLLEGFSPSEIARAMGVSPARISKRIKNLKKVIQDVAEYYAENGDDTILELMERWHVGNTTVSGNRFPVKDDKELKRQLTNVNIKI